MAKQPISKAIAGPRLMIYYIATAKYQNAMLLYQQEKAFERLKVELSRQIMTNAGWLKS